MTKSKKTKPPSFVFRKPVAASADDFVASVGRPAKSKSAARKPSGKGRGAPLSPSDEVRRRTTVAFRASVFRRLRLHCAGNDAALSDVIDQAVEAFLAKHGS